MLRFLWHNWFEPLKWSTFIGPDSKVIKYDEKPL